MPEKWHNWSGGVECQPNRLGYPADSLEVVDLVKQAVRAGQRVRVAGAGHSFTPIVATDGCLLSLERISGINAVDEATKSAEIFTGTPISALGKPLFQDGLGLANQGDIDRQALAGALATGTHGTGITLGSLSTQLSAIKLVTATGELVELTSHENPNAFKAAQVSLGLLGVMIAVRLDLVPAYCLHERLWRSTVVDCFAELDQLIQQNRHFEFFWQPQDDLCDIKTLNPVPGPPDPLSDLAGERIDYSYRIFPSERHRLFNECEFAVPLAQGPDCFHELRELMRQHYPDVYFPIEYRTQAADDIYLSPVYGRDSVTLSVHQAAHLPYQTFFADCEAIFRNHSGRPHLGKLHNFSVHDFAEHYPAWGSFCAIRAEFDPKGLFLNDYLAPLFV